MLAVLAYLSDRDGYPDFLERMEALLSNDHAAFTQLAAGDTQFTQALSVIMRASNYAERVPPAVSGSSWTTGHLRAFNITIQAASQQQLLTANGAVQLKTDYKQSTDANAVSEACASIDVNAVTSAKPLQLSSLAHKLYKFLCLIRGPDKYDLESFVVDFMIRLLSAMGFEEGPLVVLGPNRIRLAIDRRHTTVACADVSVLDRTSQLRLVVCEHKRDIHIKDKDAEAQMIAAAIAATQVNLKLVRNSDYIAKHGLDGKVAPQAGMLFMIRVYGDRFSFYSVRFDEQVVRMVADYSLRQQGIMPETIVWKYRHPAGGDIKVPSSEFLFSRPAHRTIILDMLDRIRHQISAPASGR